MKTNWTYKATATPDYAKQYAVYSEESGKTVALVYHGEQAEQNARLIAAAPALLEALQSLMSLCVTEDGLHGQPEQWEEMLQARAVLSTIKTEVLA